jgi:tagatose 1,6-diphosphate aldolase
LILKYVRMNTKIFTKNGHYLMLALDHRGSFKKLINPQDPEAVPTQKIIETKYRLIQPIYDQLSGILIDPVFGLPAFNKVAEQNEAKKPYLLCTEKSGYESQDGGRLTNIQYPTNELKDMGAQGVKLLLYFNPHVKAADHQLTIGKRALDDAHQNDLPIFIEIVTYTEKDKKDTTEDLLMSSLEMFIDHHIVPDVWKLEYPGSLEACQKITALAANTPWILLTRGSQYDTFKQQLQDAAKAGASGFLAGRALWQEALGMEDEKQQIFLEHTFIQRFTEICSIMNKK